MKCPRCGVEVELPKKEWEMKPGKSTGVGPRLKIKQYCCPQCGKSFRGAERLPEQAL